MRLEDRLRATLRERVAGLAARPEAWSSIQERLARRRRRAAASRAGIIALALVVSALSTTALWRAFQGATGPTEESERVPLNPHLAATIRLDGPIRHVAAAGGDAWVATERRLIIIDGGTNQARPLRVPEGARGDLVFGAGSLWVSTFDEVLRLDPRTGALLSVVRHGSGIGPMAGDDSAIWVATWGREGCCALTMIDPETGAVAARVPLSGAFGLEESPHNLISDLAVGEGAVWAIQWERGAETVRSGHLIRVDPRTRAVTGAVPVGHSSRLAVGEGAAWISSETEGPIRVDAATLDVTRLGAGLRAAFNPFAAAKGGVWFVDSTYGRGIEVVRMDARTFRVDLAIPIPGNPMEIALDEQTGTIWHAAGRTITRIDLYGPGDPLTIPDRPGWVTHRHRDAGVSIQAPWDWVVRENPSGPVAPRPLFGVGTYLFQSGGECAPTRALQRLPADGAFLWLMEYPREGAGADPEDFPPRPRHFQLDPQTLANYECSGNWGTYLIRFRDDGRLFDVHVALGASAAETVRSEVLQVLDSLDVGPAG